MRTTLDLDEKTAQKLRELAAANGVSLDQLLATYVPGLRQASGNGTNADEAVLAFDQWSDSFPQDSAPLSDEAISRASVYRDR